MVGSKKDSYWAQYQDLLIRRPVAMNITQGGIITAAGNVVAQMVTESTVKAQPLIEQVLLTVCFIAPVVSKWIPFLGGLRLHWAKATAVDQVLHRPQLRPRLRRRLRLRARRDPNPNPNPNSNDQFLFSPLFNVAIFFVMAAAFKGGIVLTSGPNPNPNPVVRAGIWSLGGDGTGAGLSVPLATHTHDAVLWLSLWPERFPPVMAFDPIWSTLSKAYRLWLPAVAVRELCGSGVGLGVIVAVRELCGPGVRARGD